MIDAPFATPENDLPAVEPLPAAIPATCVPWSHAHSAVEQVTPEAEPSCSSWPCGQIVVLFGGTVLEKHASSTTFPWRNGWDELTPVSRTATTWPVPSKPCAQSRSPSTRGRLAP